MWLEHFLITEVNESNLYLIACERTREAALIDAAACPKAMLHAIHENDFQLKTILITHDHYDHTSGLPEILNAFPTCEILGAKSIACPATTRMAKEGDTLKIGDLTLRILGLAGHTPDSLGYFFTQENENTAKIQILFSGDALFAGSVGGTISEADHNLEIANIRSRIFSLPESTLIFPGHGPATTVRIEKKSNPFFSEIV